MQEARNEYLLAGEKGIAVGAGISPLPSLLRELQGEWLLALSRGGKKMTRRALVKGFLSELVE